MKVWKVLVLFAAAGLVGGVGFVVGSQGQQHDLGLEQALSENGPAPESPGAVPGVPVSGNAAFTIVGQQGDYVLVELMIKQGDTWRPAKIQSPGSGFEYVGGE